MLKPGGRFLCLEFSEVDDAVLDRIYDAWSFNVIPRSARRSPATREPYRYLVESIRRFPSQRDFAAMIATPASSASAGATYSGGIAALHSGWKL